MALAVNGSGTIFKKCDRSNHRPDSNKGCASSTCQHTCDTPERCQHAWTLRYWVNGNSRDRYLHSYRTYVQGMFGGKTLVQVAQDRDGVTEHLTATMKHLSNTPRQQARLVIVGTCDEAVKAGRLARHHLADIALADHGPKNALALSGPQPSGR
jgi:hypothetical protein